MKTPDVLLKTHQLSIGYSGKSLHYLFKDLEVSLVAGQLVCFMGPNGIGKSTLIRTLAGLQKPLSGSVNISSGLNEAPRQVAVVLTDRITASNMTVYELITFGRYPYLDWSIKLSQEDKLLISRAIAEVHIQHLVDKKLYELSDGQLQMAMIARALTQDTPVILLDEPTAHLDLNNRVEIMKLLRKLARAMNKAILVATHDLDLALQTADRIWLTGTQQNILTGIPEDLVLSGVFDDIFQFKGFDLRTGKILHEPYRDIKVQLTGTGYEYLWTRNALERNGIEVTDAGNGHRIVVQRHDNSFVWTLDTDRSFSSLSTLLEQLLASS